MKTAFHKVVFTSVLFTVVFLGKSFANSHLVYEAVNSLNENSNLTQKEVAKLTFKDNANITRMLDKLEKKGLVIRHPDTNDRRSWNLSITKKGIKIRDLVESLAVDILDKISKGISKKDMELYNNISKKIINNLVE